MINIGILELVVIFSLVIIVIGPNDLPAFIRKVGKILTDFKRATNGFKNNIREELENSAVSEIQELKTLARDINSLKEEIPINKIIDLNVSFNQDTQQVIEPKRPVIKN